jgi:hypothetical protein
MNEQKNDKWLDDLISRTINTQKPQFDDEKWKQKFHEEFQALQSRAKAPAHPVRWTSFLKSPVVKFAAAAVIIMAISFFVYRSEPAKQVDIPEETNVLESPIEMLTLSSLNAAYRNGGIEAVEAQCDKAMARLAAPSETITIDQLLAELDNI